MPEGHTLHRLATTLRESFAGRRVAASSPQGRFADSAALLDGGRLVGATSWGKHLFADFDGRPEADPTRIGLHVHLGLYGSWDGRAGPAPAPVGQVRLRLETTAAPWAYADLRAATTCELVTPEQRAAIEARLGPDPLRPDSEPESAWRRVRRSPAPIGALLMDQEVLSGVGNVYRAEVLFRHRIDPMRPGRTLRRAQFQALWDDLRELMADGVRCGSINTVRPEHLSERPGRHPLQTDCGADVYVYKRAGEPCLVCGRPVRATDLRGRNLFWCPGCQRRYRSRAYA